MRTSDKKIVVIDVQRNFIIPPPPPKNPILRFFWQKYQGAQRRKQMRQLITFLRGAYARSHKIAESASKGNHHFFS